MLEQRVFTWEFKESVARRMLAGESVSALHHELQIKRSVLYRWFHAYRKEGVAGLQRSAGRPPGVPNPPQPAGEPGAAAARRIAELERAGFGKKPGQTPQFLFLFMPHSPPAYKLHGLR